MRGSVRMLAALVALAALPAAAPAATRTTVLTGVVQAQHADAKRPGDPARAYLALRTSRGLVGLRLAGPSSLVPGSYVRVRGVRRGSTLRVRSVRRLAPAGRGARALVAQSHVMAAPSSPSVAVIMINFSNDARTPFTAATVESAMFTGAGNVTAYYAEQSFGKTSLTGTVFGWYTIADTNADCDFLTWANQANAAVGGALSGYTHRMYVFPEVASCAWAGLGDLSGPETWINGYVQLRVMAHELGHNFGVHHANSLYCASGGTRTSLTGTCSSDEYGDPFSIMGSGSTRQFPAFHKGELGWLQPTATYTVTESGTYTIAAAELDSASTHLLRIPRTGGALYVDVRQPFGTYFDNFVPGSAPVAGVMIRRGPAAYAMVQPDLIDATPGTPSYGDAALAVGQSLTDPDTGVTITTDAITAGGATVTVTIPGAPAQPPTAPPSVTVTPSAPGATDVDITWTAATDDVGVTGYRVYRNGVLIASPTGLSHHDAPGQGMFSYGVAAIDGDGLVGPVAGAPPTSLGDATAPTAPTGLASTVTGATVKLTWAASTDNVGVTGYRVYRNGALLKSTAAAPTLALDTTSQGGHAYAYAVRAFDAAGNLSAASNPLPVSVPDGTAPGAVTALKVTVKSLPWGATLTWGAATDAVGVTGYRVYRNGALIATRACCSYTDPGLPHSDMAVYAVAAVDAAGNEGPRARISAVAPDGDVSAPTAPRSFKAKALTKRRVRLTWGAATDDVGVVRYEILKGTKVLLKTTKRSLTLKVAGRKGQKVTLLVRAVDAVGKRSKIARVAVRLR